MLLAIRERIMGVVGWIILGILFVAFSLFGLDSYLQSSVTNYAAAVNDQEIPLARHQRAYQQLRARMTEMLGENYDPALLNEDILKANALQQLISEEVLLQAANEAGFAASNRMVAASLDSIDAFKVDGIFSKEQYERILGYQGMRPPQFEHSLKQEIIANQLKNGIRSTSAATRKGLDNAFLLEGQQRKFSYVVLPMQPFIDKVAVTDSDIEDYYTANSSSFMTPERVRLEYLELNAADIDPGIDVDEVALQALYDEQSAKYVTPEERHARHILVALLPDADEATQASALEKANTLVARLDAGEPFDVLAKELSDDPGSAATGGDLGFFARGMMTASFDEAVFALQTGERSQPVKTPFGYHIIELLEVKPEVATPLAEVRDELVNQLLAEERGDLFFEQSEALASLAFEQPDSLQGAADELDLEINQTDWVEKSGGTGIAEHASVIETAFSDDVLLNGNNSAPIEVGNNHLIVVRILEHQEAAQQPLEQVRADVSQLVRDEQARLMTQERGKELLDSLSAPDATLQSLASANELTNNSTELLTRNATEPDRAIVSAAFSIQPAEAGAISYDGRQLANGDYVIIALEETRQGSFADLPEAAQQQAWRALSRVQGEAEGNAFLSALREQAVIQIPESSDDQ
jgi:peptidyl-prolyl cis-trans isomerase D